MPTPLNLLIVEDRPEDAELAVHELRRVGFEPAWNRVDTQDDYLARLGENPDVILADYRMPEFGALRALELLRASGRDIPLIVVTGALGDEAAVECLNKGAADYLLKDRLARLGKAVSQALKRKELERQFLRSQRMESIGTLASGIAHDLNNVLTPILASIAVLRRTTKAAVFERTLSTIESSARRGADIIRQVLTFARGVEGERKTLFLKPLIDGIARIADKTFPKSIDFRQDLAPDLWPVIGDETQIDQVLLNLCINARDAMPSGGRLSISSRNVKLDEETVKHFPGARPGPFVLIEVEDTGMGIPPEITEHIFDPFFTTKQPGRGTGLGLSTLTGILKSHGGLVKVDSQVNQGSRFRVYLPAVPAGNSIPVPASANEIKAGEGRLVLVVDDEPSVREVTRTILESSGYEVLLSEDGTEALEYFKEHRERIAAVLTDLMMPGMDGRELLRNIREIAPEVSVMAFSGVVSDEERGITTEDLRELGVKAFLQKPFTAENLLSSLQATLG